MPKPRAWLTTKEVATELAVPTKKIQDMRIRGQLDHLPTRKLNRAGHVRQMIHYRAADLPTIARIVNAHSPLTKALAAEEFQHFRKFMPDWQAINHIARAYGVTHQTVRTQLNRAGITYTNRTDKQDGLYAAA